MTELKNWWRNFKNDKVAHPSISFKYGQWLALDGWVMGWGDSAQSAYDSWLINRYKGRVVRNGTKTQWMV